MTTGQVNRECLVDADQLKQLARQILEAAGFRADDAELVAEVLIEADLRGVDSHGVTRLRGYLSMVEAGHVNLRPDVTVVRESGAMALLDGDSGVGIIAARQAIDRAVELARESGIGCVSLRNVSHTGMIGWYTMRAARQGLIGIAMNNGPAIVPLFGGRESLVATNPLSIAAPSSGEIPVVLDMATTMVAGGKLRLASKRGVPIPDHWALDRDGQPTTDPDEAIRHGFFQWAGGYKGSGLALMIEILGGVLSGGLFGRDVPPMIEYGKDPLISNAFYVAVDVARFLPLDEFRERVDQLIDQARGSEPIDPDQPVLVPGDKEADCRVRRLAEGIPISERVVEELEGLVEKFGLRVAPLRSAR